MKKLVLTLDIDNYAPELMRLTRPFQELHAAKIGADFKVISSRKFPDMPASAEKFQTREFGRDYDYTLYVDADALILPDCPDLFEMFNDKSCVFFNGVDNRLDRFKADIYSRRSNSRVGACTWLVGASNWNLEDLWTPPQDFEASVKNISLMWCEAKTGQCAKEHLIDDYTLSCNIARYGLKVRTVTELVRELNRPPVWFTHLYNCSLHDKMVAIRRRLDEEGISY